MKTTKTTISLMIIFWIVVGVGLSSAAVWLAEGYCLGSTSYQWCAALYHHPPWVLLVALLSGPPLAFGWWWHTMVTYEAEQRVERITQKGLETTEVNIRKDSDESFLHSMQMIMELVESDKIASMISGLRVLIRLVRSSLENEQWDDAITSLETLNDIYRRIVEAHPDTQDRPERDAEAARVIQAATRSFAYSGAILSRANLQGINLQGANLQRTNLEGAYLDGANLESVHMEGANLQGANLEGAYLEGALLQEANLWNAFLEGAHLKGANLWKADLEGAYLEGAHFNMGNLQTILEANVEGAYLEGALLKGANLRGANLVKVNLKGANLDKANLCRANLEGSNLYRANLKGANLKGANLKATDLTKANFRRAHLEGANLRGAKGANLARAFTDDKMKLPSDS